jgi:hypothetical protein
VRTARFVRLLRLLVLVALVLSLAAPPAGAGAKPKPKPDRTPPHSVIHTKNMAIKIGTDADQDAPAQPPATLLPYSLVEGRTTDNKGGLIDYVVIRFSHDDPLVGTAGAIETATCEPPRRVCNWTARVPWLDDDLIMADPVLGLAHGVPAIWNVTVKGYDEAGNVETNGPAIQIVVI